MPDRRPCDTDVAARSTPPDATITSSWWRLAQQTTPNCQSHVVEGVMPTSNPAVFFFTTPLSRWESLKLRLTWPYIRQTRLLNPLTEWWLNRGN